MSAQREIALVVHREVMRRLDEFDAYPAKVLRLECEAHGVYQNQSNTQLDGLEDQGVIDLFSVDVDGTDRTFFREAGSSANPSSAVIDATALFYELIESQGFFGDLCIYVALCKIYDELGENIMGMEVLPEGARPHLLNGPGRKPDALVSFEEEYVPIEVFNGADYISTSHDKYGQLRDYAEISDDVVPFLIGRRCDDNLKNVVTREWNGTVVHTDSILWCESANPEASDVLDIFQLDDLIDMIPKLESSTGREFDGDDFHNVATSEEPQDVRDIRPPERFVDAAADLPSHYVDRIRGGIQLHYVESLWRRFDDSDYKGAAIVLQGVYRQLIWNNGMDPDDAIDNVWNEYASDRITESARRKGDILQKVDELYDMLCTKDIIWEDNGLAYARSAANPVPYLDVN